MDFEYFKNKKITVFGLGLHGGGVGIVKFLVLHGAKVVVTDIKTKEDLSSSLAKLKGIKNIEYVLGQHRKEDFLKTDMVIKSPAANWDNPHIKLALENNIPVEMDSGLFFKLCKNPIIGVTGSKGKTTTSSLIFQILKKAGKNPEKIGIGQISVLDKLKNIKKDKDAEMSLYAKNYPDIWKQLLIFSNIVSPSFFFASSASTE
jgi:UDP-N-acetylmuramoylalanine--D-glutamate ligase